MPVMLIALAFIAFFAMVASWIAAPEKKEAESTSMVPAGAAAD